MFELHVYGSDTGNIENVEAVGENFWSQTKEKYLFVLWFLLEVKTYTLRQRNRFKIVGDFVE